MKTDLRVVLAFRETPGELAAAVQSEPGMRLAGVVHDGEAAYSLVRQCGADILVADMLLPRLDGLGLANKLRETENPPAVLMISSFFSDYVCSVSEQLGIHLLLSPASTGAMMAGLRRIAGHCRK